MPQSERCRIVRTVEGIKAASYCNIVYLGGSLTSAAGAGNAAVTSWRRLFIRYIYERYHTVYHCQPMEVMAGVGAMESYGAVFTLERNVKPYLPVLAFVEFCVNDRGAPDRNLVGKGIEGMILQLKSMPTHPDVALIGAGCRPGSAKTEDGLIDHSLHREIADYYGLAFVDIQSYMLDTLAARGQSWDDISITFEDNDDLHLNDYGNRLWFEGLREWFEEQWRLHDLNPTQSAEGTLPKPMFSDELQSARLVNPARRNKAIVKEGNWEKRDAALVPWYLDDLLVGRPGDKLTYTFTGTSIGTICLVHGNGLKMEATLDGRPMAGPYTNFAMEFGKFFMIAHGLENAEHVLELEVGKPMKTQNKLEDPTAQIGYLAVAG